MIALPVVLLPQPDSPASPTVSPALIVRLTWSTARTGAPAVSYSTTSSSSSSSGLAGPDRALAVCRSPRARRSRLVLGVRADGRVAADERGAEPPGEAVLLLRRAQPRIAHLVDPGEDEDERDDGQREREARGRATATTRPAGSSS